MKANFLLYPDSFLNILSPDGFKNLRILDATISDAKQKGDTIYGNPLFAQLILSNGTQLLDLMNSAVQRPIGFTNDHFKMLVKYFWNKSPNASIDWISLNQEPELKNQNNGMMGLPVNTKSCPDEKYVYNIPSWYEFHCKFLTANNHYIDWPDDEEPKKQNLNDKKTILCSKAKCIY